MSFRNIWKEYFSFNRKERNGTLLILAIGCILSGWLAYYRYFFQPAILSPDSMFLEKAASFEELIKKTSSTADTKATNNLLPYEQTFFYFNPNELNDSMGNKLGIPPYLTSRIINYVNKGGSFRIKKDLLKIYGMDSALFYSLEPYILLPDSVSDYRKLNAHEINRVETPPEVFDLNDCTFNQLVSIKGIGEWRANKILNYRNRLGGFTSVEQLLEIKTIDTVLFEEIKKQLKVESPVFRKISLKNFNSSKTYHPYLSRKLSDEIEKKMFLNPHLTNPEELRSLPSMNDSIWKKLSPYLTVD